jgi:voltage-gated potassium channel
MSNAPGRPPALGGRGRPVTLGLFRSLGSTTVLVLLYYVLPLKVLAKVPLAVILLVALLILLASAAWQVRDILRARYPGVRAAEALGTTVSLFLLLFASVYYVMERASPGSFSQSLTRTDSLYFAVTVFSTVGFGDITAVSQSARLLVTVQMILDLLALGLGIKVFVGAVQLARRAHAGPDSPAAAPEQPGQ